VVAFTKDGSVFLADEQMLTMCNPAGLKRGNFNGMRIIDMSGKQFVVKSARKLRTDKPWWRPPLFLTFLVADLDMEENASVSLRDPKKALLKADFVAHYEDFDYNIEHCGSFNELAEYLRKPQSP
jgi:hypothetical protein